ncbi:MAG: A/G-specific adenine glycosylase [Runella sp.]
MINKFFAYQLLKWYAHHHRDLPWRHTRNPYYIWLSEVILQQTRVAQGLPYYEKFVTTFPTIEDLAEASDLEVLRLWQGLGYYSRARNLHQTAKYIAFDLKGQFPQSYSQLLQLKGIGPYTAAAIASFAFDEPVAVVDGNVYRVLARFFGIEADIASGAGQRIFAQLAQELISHDQPAAYNQAIMEFGAIQCTPTSPDCLLCPLKDHCQANATGKVGLLPVKQKKIKTRERFFNYFVVIKQNKVALRQRTARDVWQGLYDFYLIETTHLWQSLDELTDQILMPLLKEATVKPPSGVHLHVLTHQRIHAQFWQVYLSEHYEGCLPMGYHFFDTSTIEKLPKPVLIDNYWKTADF